VSEAADEVWIDLFEIVPGISIDYHRYWQSERDVITPALIEVGYQVGPWYTADGDSFGSLSRAAKATAPDGRSVTVSYG
jgi:hypothetical protein